MYIVDKGGRHCRRRPFYEGGMQTGRQTDRQTSKGKEKRRKKRKKSISPLKYGELLALLCCTFYTLSLSLSPYYLTLMPFSFGVDDTSFAPFLD